jgi:hypothetical protein
MNLAHPGFPPHRIRNVVGLYVDPPAHAIVLSVDEKSQIQALDRTQLSMPLKKGRAGTVRHDYKRHGTRTPFAALNTLDGTVVSCNMQRHRHQEFIRFLNSIEELLPAGKTIKPLSIIMRITNIPRYANGLPTIPAGLSTSFPLRRPGSMLSRDFSRRAQSGG